MHPTHQLVPPAFADGYRNQVESIHFRFRKTPGSAYKATYSVAWTENDESVGASSSESVQSLSDRSSMQSRVCDGPCQMNLPVHELSLMGLCEHAVCANCLQRAPRVQNAFGVLGCPNRKCYLLDEAALFPDKNKRLAQIRKVYEIVSNSERTNKDVSKRARRAEEPRKK